MNLYIESVADYLIREWDRALAAESGPREARFIVESLDPESVFALFAKLDAHRLVWLQRRRIVCHFRVATALWREWCRPAGAEARLDQAMMRLGAEGRSWIDEEDRLTWYRNRTKRDEGADGLVVVLVGLNHATDQGGLVDFHRVDEARIWRDMDQSFVPWIRRINERLGLNASEGELEQFDCVLQQLFRVRPLRLGKLAEFLKGNVLVTETFYRLSDVSGRFFQELPFWGIPPLFSNENGSELRGTKGATALKEADAFISHRGYKTSFGQERDLDRIAEALDDPEFKIPNTQNGEKVYESVEAYKKTLEAFILKADSEARELLLRTDVMPLLAILRRKIRSRNPRRSIATISGISLEAILQGIWTTLGRFSKNCDGRPVADSLGRVHVKLERFYHDLTADEEEGVGVQESARKLLKGCLGGLDVVFEHLDCRLPVDEEQARLPRTQWKRHVPITLDLALDSMLFRSIRTRPCVEFKVSVSSIDPEEDSTEAVFRWALGPTQPERVRFECAKKTRATWNQESNRSVLLPAFRVPSVAMTALYFSTDADEASRLLTQAMTDFKLIDLLAGLSRDQVDVSLWALIDRFSGLYRAWLDESLTHGYYDASAKWIPLLLSAFEDLAKKVLDKSLLGSVELLRRFYKSFLLVDTEIEVNNSYLGGALIWGLSPAVMELTQARVGFLADGFPEVVGELAVKRDADAAFDRLLDLAQIHRPLAALVVDSQRRLSAAIKSFGLLHYLGPEPPIGKTLAVQTLLRSEESDDDNDVSDIVRPCEERQLVARVLEDYQQLYPFAEDGLRILAVNVKDLQTILSGVNYFLDNYLKRTPPDWPAFHCTVTVYSTSSSPMAMEDQLSLWRKDVVDRQREDGRHLELSVGHRYAPHDQIVALLNRERRLYDVAFLFHFLRDGLAGQAASAAPFEYRYESWSGLKFPIAEYPRPIQDGDRFRRQSLLSNRRLRVQARHADLSARLYYEGADSVDHLIFGEVDYRPWVEVVETLHARAQWVCCVDPFVDKRLLCKGDPDELRKIVGFSSGLGAYGELNQTISTEQDTLTQLTVRVRDQLARLLPFARADGFEAMAVRVVGEAEEIVGLSSIRAVVGDGEQVREVVGFAAIRRALPAPSERIAMSQLVPIDSLPHWFAGGDVNLRPDLLQLSLEVRDDDIPLVQALVVECKLAKKNPVHLSKAYAQVQEGLQHLTGLLAPDHGGLRRFGFDRRYWWAQLHRAMTSRSVVNLSESERRALDGALEQLGEGEFEIRWNGAIFTFWTNEAGPKAEICSLALPADTVQPPFEIPSDFAIQHVSLGYEGLAGLFAEALPRPLLSPGEPAIRLRPERSPIRPDAPEETRSTTNKTSGTVNERPVEVSAIEAAPKPDLLRPARVGEPVGGATDSMLVEPPTVPPAEKLAPAPQPQPVPFERAPALVSSKTPEKILIGTRIGGSKEPVYWHFGHPELQNRHLLLFGASGSGKTYAIQCLLAELANQHLHSLIVDYTDGFLPAHLEERFKTVASPKSHFVVAEKLPLNPFHRQRQIIDPSIPAIEESPHALATRIESIFAAVYEMGDQQSAAMVTAIREGIEEDPGFSLRKLLPRLRQVNKQGESLANKISPLIETDPFRADEGSTWETMLNASGSCVDILQLKGLAREIQKVVTEFALWDLWNYAQNSGNKNCPIPIVLDEIQNLNHRSDSPIDKMLREGRKFGLSLILATQTTSQFDAEQRDRLFQAAHFLFFKPAITENDSFARLLAQRTAPSISRADWVQRLTRLKKGECWSLGPVLTSDGRLREEAVLVNVTSLQDRDFGR